MASHDLDFVSANIGEWGHFHVAVASGALDAAVGKTLGIRFRGGDLPASSYQSVDNVRLDWWPAANGVPVMLVNPSGEVNDGVDRHRIHDQFDPATTPDALLDTWSGSAWKQIAAAPIDTAPRSAYNAIFTLPRWDDGSGSCGCSSGGT